jgi:hypothetical protein
MTASSVPAIASIVAVSVPPLGASIQNSVDDDEHKLIDSGTVLGDRTLRLYSDYAQYGIPGLLSLHAALYVLRASYLLAARLFSTACAFLISILDVSAASRSLRIRRPAIRSRRGREDRALPNLSTCQGHGIVAVCCDGRTHTRLTMRFPALMEV